MTKQTKPEFEKVRQLRLRFGFRLKSIFWPLDNVQVNQILEKTGYKDFQLDANDGIRAAKNNVNFYSDRVKMVFGFHATTTDTLIAAQKEFFASSQKDFAINLNTVIRFYEIENAISYHLDNSKNTLGTIFSDSSDMSNINRIIGQNIILSKLEVGSANTSIYDDDWFSVEISPKPESTANEYYCRMIKRSKNADDAIQTLRKSKEILIEMAKFAEKKQS